MGLFAASTGVDLTGWIVKFSGWMDFSNRVVVFAVSELIIQPGVLTKYMRDEPIVAGVVQESFFDPKLP